MCSKLFPGNPNKIYPACASWVGKQPEKRTKLNDKRYVGRSDCANYDKVFANPLLVLGCDGALEVKEAPCRSRVL